RGGRAGGGRKMARDEVEHLSVAHERVVVRLVAEGRTSLAELLKGRIDQAARESFLFEELVARRQVRSGQVRQPLFLILVVELLAQRGEDWRGDDALARQQIRGIGARPRPAETVRR